MGIEHSKILARQEVAQGTMAFHIAKPTGFEFRPGQAFEIQLPGTGSETSTEDRVHAFSIVSAPHENELMFATRMRDSVYKRALGAMPVGAALDIDGPFGSLTLHKNLARAAVLIAGGIGITPFMSMLRSAAMRQLPQDLVLLYSNRRPEDAAFLSELQTLEQQYPRFRLKATMTDIAHSAAGWNGDTRTIDGVWLRQAIEGLAEPIFYVAGPPAMVAAMRQILLAAGIDEDDVRSEEFYGY
ncbi:ferredoxin--NADP reductase [Comamonas guangdongensis]|uniref:Ferredoxin--NADP reductase n=1 Tax=Comamonas guangdongensis TaxID=510515 RepID=A0ABV3ZVL2_9BURK